VSSIAPQWCAAGGGFWWVHGGEGYATGGAGCKHLRMTEQDTGGGLYPPRVKRDSVNGRRVVRDEVVASGLSKRFGRLVPLHRLRLLTLDDGSQTFGCRDCVFTGARGDVMGHWRQVHGLPAADAAAKRPDVGTVEAHELWSMTLRELWDLAKHVEDWETVFAQQNTERDRERQRHVQEQEQLRERLAVEVAARRKAERELTALKKRLTKMVGG
jgi:hypothetical protein